MSTPGAPGYVAVVGGMNVDFHVHPLSGSYIRGSSNPSRIEISPGGVARNIAENLARLGVPVHLLGAVGADPLSELLLSRSQAAGVNLSAVRRIGGGGCGIYIALMDGNGDLEVAASDMAATDAVDPVYIDEHRHVVEHADFVVADTNLTTESLQRLVSVANHGAVPLIVEPVSVEKARRMANLKGDIFAVTPSEAEAEVLEEIAARNTDCCELRIRHTIVTCAEKGVRWRDSKTGTSQVVSAQKVEQIDATGAGDALVAGLISGLYRGLEMYQALAVALGVAAKVVGSPGSTLDSAQNGAGSQ